MLRKIDFSQESQCLSVLLILKRAADAAGGLCCFQQSKMIRERIFQLLVAETPRRQTIWK